jgi:FkbM family methyltransferase
MTTILTWLDRLLSASSANQFREALVAGHPALAVDRLRQCAILGASGEGVRFAETCKARGIEVLAIVDNNPARQGGVIAGCTVTSSEVLRTLDRHVPILVASHRGHGARTQLKETGFQTVELLSLLQVMSPEIYTPHMFFKGWLEATFASRDQLVALSRRLHDDESRRVLDALIGFRLTVDPDILATVADLELYGPRNLFALGTDEVYVDGGTFDGDSIRWFIERTGGQFEQVIGFEPDPKTYARLCANFKNEARVVAINKGLWSRDDVLRFVDDASRGAILGEHGTIEVPVTSLDEVMSGKRVSYVKMNIEGAEIEALRGACRTITDWKPKMAISVYHRPDDLWAIAHEIDVIRSDYRLFLRQQDIGVIETVLYALP